jgi:hypothetical protein
MFRMNIHHVAVRRTGWAGTGRKRRTNRPVRRSEQTLSCIRTAHPTSNKTGPPASFQKATHPEVATRPLSAVYGSVPGQGGLWLVDGFGGQGGSPGRVTPAGGVAGLAHALALSRRAHARTQPVRETLGSPIENTRAKRSGSLPERVVHPGGACPARWARGFGGEHEGARGRCHRPRPPPRGRKGPDRLEQPERRMGIR